MLPPLALNSWTVAALNELYFCVGARKRASPALVPAYPYFFPLDAIGNWNRIYGRRGFVQHQSVLPISNAEGTLTELLDRITKRRGSSFLAVLKKLGVGSGSLSFPMPGYSLALDFPIARDVFRFWTSWMNSLWPQAAGFISQRMPGSHARPLRQATLICPYSARSAGRSTPAENCSRAWPGEWDFEDTDG
jgi:hypothetical protein